MFGISRWGNNRSSRGTGVVNRCATTLLIQHRSAEVSYNVAVVAMLLTNHKLQ